ncbi:MAG: hypothetical protein GY832_45310 [Chloroflexi bacterium]|nr:hypothetical protein [Chloroflexota bacterium]
MNQRKIHKPFTVEAALWVLIAIIALALRLARLDAAPLSSREAREAILAWRAVTGQGMPTTGYSPLLFGLNALIFALCGTSDGLARLWPALCGSALTLTPFLLRKHIGRMGALVAGFCLTFSPTWLFASRQLDGAIVAALGGMAVLGGLIHFFGTRENNTADRSWLALVASGLVLAVTSSSSAFGLLLTLSLASSSFMWAWSTDAMRRGLGMLKSHQRYVLAISLFTGLALSTSFGWNLSGVGALGDLLSDWIARFSPSPNFIASPITFLTVYELFILFFGIGGFVWAIRRGHRFGMLMGMWAGVSILLLLLMPSRKVLDILWPLLPLTMLVGVAIEQLVTSLRKRGDWLSEGLHIPVVTFLWIHFYLMLARYAVSSYSADQNASLILALLTVALQVLLTIIFALGLRLDAALRSVAVGTGLVLLAMMLSTGWGVAYVRPTDPREILVGQASAIEIHDLVETLRDVSWRETGLPQTLPFTLKGESDSVLVWYLRDFTARKDSTEEDMGDASIVVTVQQGAGVSSRDGYVGQDFVLRRSWDFSSVACVWEQPPQCFSFIGWLLYRTAPASPTVTVDQTTVLWLDQDE